MRGDKIYKILDFFEDRAATVADLAGVFLSAGYGASMGEIDREYEKIRQNRESSRFEREEKRDLEKYIYKLKAEGLLKEDSSRRIKLSMKGKRKAASLRKSRILGKNFFRKETSDKVIIVSYDLPLLFNRERDMLRNVLRILGFHMIHKSVWVGKVKVPRKFIVGLQKLRILKYVEILEVTKQGSLKLI